MTDPNLELLTRIVEALGELQKQFVFVGGCATGLLISDPAAPAVRATQDVDAIVAVVSQAEYHRLGESLRARGFSQTVESAEPPYRWTLAGMKLDVMPIGETVLGFSNRWYEPAMRTAMLCRLQEGLSIRLISPPYFVATKLVAFLDRGGGDYFASHDLEDVISVVDGRPELVDEIMHAESDLRRYLAENFGRMLADEVFLNALPGLVLEGSPQGRVPIVLQRLTAISNMNATMAP